MRLRSGTRKLGYRNFASKTGANAQIDSRNDAAKIRTGILNTRQNRESMRHVCLADARANAKINLNCAECMAVWARSATAGTLGSAFSIGIGIILGSEQNNIIDPLVGPTCQILVGLGCASMLMLWPIGVAVRMYASQELLTAQLVAKAERELRLRIRQKYLHGGRERLRSGKAIWSENNSNYAA